jgi:hypothetical protein
MHETIISLNWPRKHMLKLKKNLYEYKQEGEYGTYSWRET